MQIIIGGIDKSGAAFASAKSNLSLLQKASVAFTAGQVAVTAAASAAAGAFTALVKGQINAADEIGKLAQKTGITTEKLSGLKIAADLADVPLENLATSLSKFNKTIVEAAAKNGEAREAFEALKVSFRNADGTLRSTDLILGDVADAFAGARDGAEKSTIAMALFGKSGADIIPFLNGGKAAIKDAEDTAKTFGLTVSGETASQADFFNDSITTLKHALLGLGMTIAKDVLPILTQVAQRATDWAKAASVAQGQTNLVVEVFGRLAVALKTSYVIIKNVVDAAVTLALIFGYTLLNGVQGTIQVFKAWGTAVGQVILTVVDLIKQLTNLGGIISDIVTGDWAAAFERGSTIVDEMTESAKKSAGAVADAFKKSGSAVKDTFTNDLRDVGALLAEFDKRRIESAESIFTLTETIFGPKKIAPALGASAPQVSNEDKPTLPVIGAGNNKDVSRGDGYEEYILKMIAMKDKAREFMKEIELASLEGFAKERRAAEQHYNERLGQISRFIESGAMLEDEADKLRELAYQEHANKLKAIDKSIDEGRAADRKKWWDGTRQMFSDIAGAAQTFGKKGLAVWKAFSSAVALMDTYAAAIAAYKAMAGIPIVGPALGAVAAAAAIAFGLARVRQINSTEAQGQAHGGLDYVPENATYALKQGERVLQPEANQAFMEMMDGGGRGGVIQLILDNRIIGEVLGDLTRNGQFQVHPQAVRS